MHVINKFAASVALATAVVASQAQATSLIVNGGFETGDFSGWLADPVSFPMYIVTSPSAWRYIRRPNRRLLFRSGYTFANCRGHGRSGL